MKDSTIPKHWQEKTLGELCTIQLGKTPHRKTDKFWDKDKITNNIWLSIADLRHGKTISDSKEYISSLGSENINITPTGTLMLSFKLTIGRVSFAGKNLFTNEAIASLIDLKSNINKQFLFYYFSFFNWDSVTQGHEKVKGKTLNKAKLQKLPIVFPPLAEQKQIVKKLDVILKDITKAKQHTKQNIQNAKDLFTSTLNQVFNNPNNNWQEKTLGRVYDVRDGTHDSPKFQEHGYPLITSKNLKNSNITFDKIKFINKVDYDNINKRSKVNVGDILFAMIGTIGNPVVIKKKPNFAIKNVALFKIKDNQNSYFLKYYLDFATQKMIKEAKGTTQSFVGLGYLRNFSIKIPPLTEQHQIVTKLSALDTHTQELEKHYQNQLKSLEELEKSVLQKAFSGEL